MDGLNASISTAGVRAQRFVSRVPPPRPSRLRAWVPMVLCVGLPTFLAAIYLFCFASYQYVSEAKFVVRGMTSVQPTLITSLLQNAGVSRTQDDTFAVQDYITSRDALRDLEGTLDMRALFARPEADMLSAFPWPLFPDSFEHLFKHYLSKVEVVYDSTTGVTQLTVKAFRAEDAAAVATALLQGGERLVNRMNERQRGNTMRDARREVADSEARVQGVATNIAAYRNRESILDPNKQSVPLLAAITEMQRSQTIANTQLGELTKTSPNSPLIESLKKRISVLQAQIDDARRKVTGPVGSMVPQITEYESLQLQREFADKQLASAIAYLDTARMSAERQQIYLDEVVKPNVADYPLFPKRFVDLAIVFATCFVVYTIARLLLAGAREHRTM